VFLRVSKCQILIYCLVRHCYAPCVCPPQLAPDTTLSCTTVSHTCRSCASLLCTCIHGCVIGCSSWLQVQKADMDAEPTGSECAKCLSNDCLSARRHGLRRESAVAKSVAVQVVLPAAVVDGIGPQKIQNAYLIQVA
ncbi:unnamed protein product, partial [Pylaiella littoralis]